MTPPRPPKKSETLEVRLPHAAKTAFMDRCHASGLTASEVVRTLIEREVAGPRGRRSRTGWQALAAAIAGVALGAIAVPSIAQALPGSRADFDRMDADRDGVVTFAEFQDR
ncbi:EF-hand domain-containing protein [Brevundimonas sp. R86498]|uniref:EF-hand domain-containing protein n=1 Tax=Brevundimonas sp. R86498 TaxID=3093845 RepID=UPI0037C7B2AF